MRCRRWDSGWSKGSGPGSERCAGKHDGRCRFGGCGASGRSRGYPSLRAAAGEVFAASRFRAPWYDRADSGRFYAAWIEKAVLGTFDHQCLLVLNSQGQPRGFVSLRDIGGQEMRIGLLAAFPGVSGRGIGTRLMTVAIAECRRQGMQRLRVATQVGNIAALRLYQRQGAVIESTAYWLYRGRHDSI